MLYHSAALAPARALIIGHLAPGMPFASPHHASSSCCPLQTQHPSRETKRSWPWHPPLSLPCSGKRQRPGLLGPHHQGRGIALNLAGQGGLLPKHGQDSYRVQCLRSVHADPGLCWVEREHGWCRNTSSTPQPSLLLFPSRKPIWHLARLPKEA